MNILVTGAAGFIGSHLAERLAGLGHAVTGIDSFTDYYSRPLKQANTERFAEMGIRLIEADLAEMDLLPLAATTEAVFHLAAQPGISATTTFQTYLRNNIVATQRLLEAARAAGGGVAAGGPLRLFVNIATSSVYGFDASCEETAEPRPASHYGVTKLAAEQLAMATHRDGGLPVCSARLFSVYGPRERPEKLYPRIIHSILSGGEFPIYEGSEAHERSFTFVSDIIDGLVAILDHVPQATGQIFNIGTEATLTTGEGIAIVEDIMGKKARLRRMPKRPGDQLKTHARIAKARNLLGYNPTTTVRAGMEKEVAWYTDSIFARGIC
ncbi:MAG: NAD-dependent epimerase/dehydratase family protein [Candidatus Methylacidiphilales bacterium]|nr:NAD-dependent epimerase/dehydratase family protein [Candidatus Methylacidiphilales bacterium]